MQTGSKNGKAKTPLKKFTIGFEVEFLIIDKLSGKPGPGVELILKKIKEKAPKKELDIIHEVSEEMIEVGSYPDVEGSNTMKSLLENVKLLAYAADEVGLAVLPLGTYPGKFSPSMRNTPKYNLLKKLFGQNRFQTWGRLTGYHCHYSLPKGVFDSTTLQLKDLSDSKNQEYLVDAFNFFVSLDPALITFMQSSPFYQGRSSSKDSRVVHFRGDETLGSTKDALTHHPILGTLPHYVHTGTELKHRTEKRKEEWLKWCQEAGIHEKEALAPFRSILGINWSPLRVNAHGTLESRGMDMNRLPVLLSVSILIQTLLKYIQDGALRVVPHDSAKNNPFAYETGTIFIPPDTYVKNNLQKLAVSEGLASDEMYLYCKRLIGLAKNLEGEKILPLLKPLTDMLAERQTTSDKILAQARALGYKDKRKILPQSIASEIALTHAKQMFEDIVILEQMIQANAALQ